MFNDNRSLRVVMGSTDPRVMDIIAHDLNGFDEIRWWQERESLAHTANYAKFSQNPELQAHCSSR